MAQRGPGKTGALQARLLRRGDVVRLSDQSGYIVLLADPEIEDDDPKTPPVVVAEGRGITPNGNLRKTKEILRCGPTQTMRICGFDFAERIERKLVLEREKEARREREAVPA